MPTTSAGGAAAPGARPGSAGGTAREADHGHIHDHEFTLTIPVDPGRIAGLATGTVSAAGRMLTARGGLPLYLGLGVLAAADVIAWPVAAVAGLSYAILRRWGPLAATPPGTAPPGTAGAPARPGPAPASPAGAPAAGQGPGAGRRTRPAGARRPAAARAPAPRAASARGSRARGSAPGGTGGK